MKKSKLPSFNRNEGVTEDHLGGRLGRQPEDDERDEGQQEARHDEDIGVKRGHSLDLDVSPDNGLWDPRGRVGAGQNGLRDSEDLKIKAGSRMTAGDRARRVCRCRRRPLA